MKIRLISASVAPETFDKLQSCDTSVACERFVFSLLSTMKWHVWAILCAVSFLPSSSICQENDVEEEEMPLDSDDKNTFQRLSTNRDHILRFISCKFVSIFNTLFSRSRRRSFTWFPYSFRNVLGTKMLSNLISPHFLPGGDAVSPLIRMSSLPYGPACAKFV